ELRRRSRSGRREQSDVIDRRCFAIVFVTGVLPDQVHDRLRPSDSKEGCTGQSLLGRDNDDRADIEPSIDHCLLQIQILDAEQLDLINAPAEEAVRYEESPRRELIVVTLQGTEQPEAEIGPEGQGGNADEVRQESIV